MNRCTLGLLLVVGVQGAFGQGDPGLGLALDYSEEAKYGTTIQYFHPLQIQQFYVVGGYSYSKGGVSPEPGSLAPEHGLHVLGSEWVQPIPLTHLHRFFAGVQIGDYVYALPRISYNIYGDYRSVGWGFVGGFYVHPSRRIALGASLAYDRLRFDNKLDRFGPVGLLSAQLNVIVKFPR